MDPRAGFPDPATVHGEEAGNDLDGGGMGDSSDGDLSCARERARFERGGEKMKEEDDGVGEGGPGVAGKVGVHGILGYVLCVVSF